MLGCLWPMNLKGYGRTLSWNLGDFFSAFVLKGWKKDE
jgi:hypothetical protein